MKYTIIEDIDTIQILPLNKTKNICLKVVLEIIKTALNTPTLVFYIYVPLRK